MSQAVGTAPIAQRQAPPLGAFSLGVVRIEVRRLLRNRRTLIFTVIVPTLFFLIFGLNSAYATDSYGSGNVSASILISMALYGAVLATTSGGAMVSLERAAGWSRRCGSRRCRRSPTSPSRW
ncbi:MAG: hypothetical protein ACRDYZ_01655 [Acidimicrobiales bacterium]